jgi:hypothetical protein
VKKKEFTGQSAVLHRTVCSDKVTIQSRGESFETIDQKSHKRLAVNDRISPDVNNIAEVHHKKLQYGQMRTKQSSLRFEFPHAIIASRNTLIVNHNRQEHSESN